MNDYDYNITPYKLKERDFFSDPTILVNAILGKEFDAALSSLRSNPEEVSIWMVIESPQLSNEISSPSAKTNGNEQNGSRKRVSLRNLYTDNDAEEEDAEEDGGKIYLLRRLPLHFACSVIPDEKFGTMSDDAKLEELILKMIQVDPAMCKMEDNEGRLPLHEAVQNDVSTSIIESLLRNFPQASQICDTYGRTPISVRKIRSNSKSIRLDDDPIYQLLSKDSNYWLNETKSTNLLDDVSVCDDDELENNENCVANMASKAMGFGKTFGSRHEDMIARKSAEKLNVGGISPGDDTPAVDTFNLDATDHDHTSPRFNLRTVFAKSKEAKEEINSSDMAIISSVDQNELNTAESTRRRPRKGIHPFSRSAPPSQSKSRTPQLEETSDTAASSQRGGATAFRRSAIPEKDQPEEIPSNDSLPLQKRKQLRSHRSAKSDEKQSKFTYSSENSSTSTSDGTGSHKKLNKKYQKLKHDFRKIQSTNHSLAKQMRKMQVEREEQLHRMKSRTKTTISNLRSDVAKLKDEKFVLMAAMEELKNKCDHFELQNDLLRNMYESSKISAELSDDINELNVNQKEIGNVLDASDALIVNGEVDNKNDAMLTVSEDKSVLYTESSKSSCIRASNSSSSTMQQLGLTAIRKVQAATMKLSGHDLGAIRSTIDTSFTEYTATSSGTLALTAAMKMIELAKQENDDDIQTIASEALAVNAKVSSNEVNQQRYQYIQEENDKLKSELKNAEYEREDLEDLVSRLKIAVSELSSKKMRRIRASDATRPEYDEQSVPNNSAVEEQRRSPSDRSNDLAYASVHARFEAIRSNYAPMGLDYASAPSRFSAMESRIPSTDLDKLRSPSSITSSEFGTNSGKLANEQKMPATDPNKENDEENEWSEDSIDYKDEYLALLKALESSDRYATESFLTKRVRDLELQLSVTDGRKSISNGPDQNEETGATPKEIN